jgi:hydrogenase large subunit
MELELAALINTTKQQQRDAHAPRLSPGMQELVKRQHLASLLHSADPMSRLEGGLAVNCRVDLDNKSIVEAASAATFFRGYESLLPGRALDKVGLVSATASGICGGVHATASALCLEMALGIKPPPFGIVLRNLLLNCQYLSDNCMHLFVLAGPDYSQAVIEKTNPDIWTKALQSKSQCVHMHGFSHISEIMGEFNKGAGSLYREALQMVSLARQAYVLLGGKYPHSESIIPGGVSITADAHKLAEFSKLLQPFMEYSQKAAAIWDDIFDFMLAANPRYEDLVPAVPIFP